SKLPDKISAVYPSTPLNCNTLVHKQVGKFFGMTNTSENLRMREKESTSFASQTSQKQDRLRIRLAVIALLGINAGLLAYGALVHSPTLNEPGHLAAGMSNWKFGRFDIYKVNPPLVRMTAAVPVMLVGAETKWDGYYEGAGA